MSTLIYISAVLLSTTQTATTKLYGKKNSDAMLFNAIKAASALLLFVLLSLRGFTMHLPTLAYGVAYGVLLAASMLAGYKALLCGPMALTGMLASFSVAVPLLYGILFLREPLTLWKGIGLCALVLAILLVSAGKRGGGKASSRWFFYVAVTFLCNGLCSVLQKMHQTAFPTAYTGEFMLFAMLVPTLLFGILAILHRHKAIRDGAYGGKAGGIYGIVSGAANGLANYFTLLLSGMENASVLFPAISAGTVLANLLCGFLLFREKPKLTHFLAICCGIAAVVLLKI